MMRAFSGLALASMASAVSVAPIGDWTITDLGLSSLLSNCAKVMYEYKICESGGGAHDVTGLQIETDDSCSIFAVRIFHPDGTHVDVSNAENGLPSDSYLVENYDVGSSGWIWEAGNHLVGSEDGSNCYHIGFIYEGAPIVGQKSFYWAVLAGDEADHDVGTMTGPCCDNTCTQAYPDPCDGGDGGGGGAGDPYFRNFQNERFAFHGMPGEAYNLISGKNIRLNTRLSPFVTFGDAQDMTFMQDVALVFEGHQVVVSSNNSFSLDGEFFKTGSVLEVSDNLKITFSAEKKDPLAIYSEADKQKWFGGVAHETISVVSIETPEFSTEIFVVTSPRMPGFHFLDLTVSDAAPHADFHGIIGQSTAGPMASRGLNAPVEGLESDYRVSCLFANDFEFSRE